MTFSITNTAVRTFVVGEQQLMHTSTITSIKHNRDPSNNHSPSAAIVVCSDGAGGYAGGKLMGGDGNDIHSIAASSPGASALLVHDHESHLDSCNVATPAATPAPPPYPELAHQSAVIPNADAMSVQPMIRRTRRACLVAMVV